MASNLFAGNPPPNVVKWIEENCGSGFDITKTELKSVITIADPGMYSEKCRYSLQPAEDKDHVIYVLGSKESSATGYLNHGSCSDFNINDINIDFTSTVKSGDYIHTPDGIHFAATGYWYIKTITLNTPWDLASLPAWSDSDSWPVEYYSNLPSHLILYMKDGMHILVASNKIVYVYELAEQWGTVKRQLCRFIVSDASDTRFIRFCATEDGLNLVIFNGENNIISHYKTEEPFDYDNLQLVGTTDVAVPYLGIGDIRIVNICFINDEKEILVTMKNNVLVLKLNK